MSRDAHEDGYKAANLGQDLKDNPYLKGDLRHDAWGEGWLDAVEDWDPMTDD